MVSCIKLITGEDLIGEVSKNMNGDVTIKNAFAVVMVPSSQNQYSVGLAPYLVFSASKETTYRKEHVILEFEPVQELTNDYNRITGGIVIAKPDLNLLK